MARCAIFTAMHTEVGHLYHLYNQGNNKETLFHDEEDYQTFIRLTQKHLLPMCDIVAWCLMPNHFHFCIQASEASVKEVLSGKFLIQAFSRGVGSLLSTYAALLNAKQFRTGGRFRPRSKLKSVTATEDGRYDHTLIRYLHYNPVAAGLAEDPLQWMYSSAAEYAGLRESVLCNMQLVLSLGLLCP